MIVSPLRIEYVPSDCLDFRVPSIRVLLRSLLLGETAPDGPDVTLLNECPPAVET